MSKSANAGELRTPVYFKRVKRDTNENGFPCEVEENVFGKNKLGEEIPVMCKWVNAHGSEVWSSMQLSLKSPATITTRYSPQLMDETLIIYRGSDPKPYEVISVDNVEQHNTWLEIKVQRRVLAR